jgi:hypothetical protein
MVVIRFSDNSQFGYEYVRPVSAIDPLLPVGYDFTFPKPDSRDVLQTPH